MAHTPSHIDGVDRPSGGIPLAPHRDDPQPHRTWKDKALNAFSRFAGWAADAMGSASAFVLATVACLVWAISGPVFQYSDTWQLVVNTATTVLTFLAVFLIQHTQNKEGRAVQLKLDELIRATKEARNRMIDLENCTDEELKRVQAEFARRRPADVSEPGSSS